MEKVFEIMIKTDNDVIKYKLTGIFDIKNQILEYQEEDSLNTKMKLDLKNKLLIRENKELLLVNKLEENKITKGNAFIKELNENVDLLIKTNKLEISDNKIYLEYVIVDSNETVIYEIKY